MFLPRNVDVYITTITHKVPERAKIPGIIYNAGDYSSLFDQIHTDLQLPVYFFLQFAFRIPGFKTALTSDSSLTMPVSFTKAPSAMMLAKSALPSTSLALWVIGSS